MNSKGNPNWVKGGPSPNPAGHPDWKKGGRSPNPGGRPKAVFALRRKCRRMTKDILKRLYEIVTTSDELTPVVSASKLILGYGYGAPEAIPVDEMPDMSALPPGLDAETLRAVASMPIPAVDDEPVDDEEPAIN